MFTDLPVLKVLTQAVEENLNDCSGQKGHKYIRQLKDLFRQVVSAKPSFVDAWRLYARVAIIKPEGKRHMIWIMYFLVSLLINANSFPCLILYQ